MTDSLAAIALSSLRAAGLGVLVFAPFALAAGLALSRPFPGRWLAMVLVYAPAATPPVTVGYALLLVFGPQAPIGAGLSALGWDIAFTWRGAALAAGVMAFPFMANAARAAGSALDWSLMDAARSLGARRMRAIIRIILPLAAPGLAAGVALGFARALSEFGATITLVGDAPNLTPTTPVAIWTALARPGGETMAAALAIMSLLIGAAAMALSETCGKLARRQHR